MILLTWLRDRYSLQLGTPCNCNIPSATSFTREETSAHKVSISRFLALSLAFAALLRASVDS